MAEVVISLAISVVAIGSIWSAYINNSKILGKSVRTAAANALLVQRMEQIRGARWDTRAWPLIDELVATNFPTTVQLLNLPNSSTNLVYATNTTTIKSIKTSPPMRLITVECTWKDDNGIVYTNSIVAYRSPAP